MKYAKAAKSNTRAKGAGSAKAKHSYGNPRSCGSNSLGGKACMSGAVRSKKRC